MLSYHYKKGIRAGNGKKVILKPENDHVLKFMPSLAGFYLDSNPLPSRSSKYRASLGIISERLSSNVVNVDWVQNSANK